MTELKENLHNAVDAIADMLKRGNKVQIAGSNPVKIFEVSMRKVGEVQNGRKEQNS